jgi:hypothetical protein
LALNTNQSILHVYTGLAVVRVSSELIIYTRRFSVTFETLSTTVTLYIKASSSG